MLRPAARMGALRPIAAAAVDTVSSIDAAMADLILMNEINFCISMYVELEATKR